MSKDNWRVMKAYDTGSEVLSKLKSKDNWVVDNNPTWNWEKYDYKLNIKSKYVVSTDKDRKFDTMRKALTAIRKHLLERYPYEINVYREDEIVKREVEKDEQDKTN